MCIHVWFHIRWIGKRRYRERYFSRRIFSAFDVDNDNVLGLYIKNKYLTASIQFNVLSQNQHQALAVQENICHIGQKYDEKTNKVFCSVCMQAYKYLQIKRPITGFSDDLSYSTFVISGFYNFKKGIERFNNHEKCNVHRHAVTSIHSTKQESVLSMVSTQSGQARKDARFCLTKIFEIIRFLTIQGLPLRGHNEQNSNFIQLLYLRSGCLFVYCS